jgi:hypothetical protein
MNEYPVAFAHGNIQEVLPDIFIVTGASILVYLSMRAIPSKKATIW